MADAGIVFAVLKKIIKVAAAKICFLKTQVAWKSVSEAIHLYLNDSDQKARLIYTSGALDAKALLRRSSYACVHVANLKDGVGVRMHIKNGVATGVIGSAAVLVGAVGGAMVGGSAGFVSGFGKGIKQVGIPTDHKKLMAVVGVGTVCAIGGATVCAANLAYKAGVKSVPLISAASGYDDAVIVAKAKEKATSAFEEASKSMAIVECVAAVLELMDCTFFSGVRLIPSAAHVAKVALISSTLLELVLVAKATAWREESLWLLQIARELVDLNQELSDRKQ